MYLFLSFTLNDVSLCPFYPTTSLSTMTNRRIHSHLIHLFHLRHLFPSHLFHLFPFPSLFLSLPTHLILSFIPNNILLLHYYNIYYHQPHLFLSFTSQRFHLILPAFTSSISFFIYLFYFFLQLSYLSTPIPSFTHLILFSTPNTANLLSYY